MEDLVVLLKSYLYLSIIWGVVLLYVYFIYIIYRYLKKCFLEKGIAKFGLDTFKISLKESKIKFFLLFFLGANFSLYTAQRSEWINKNTTHHNAKEYFVAGTPIIFYKKVLNLLFKPDSIVMKPFDVLSHALYDEGVALLPENDGERYYWQYRYFNYWYIRGAGYMPDYDAYHPKPITKEQQVILNSMYDVMKGLATSKIEDQKINGEKYKAFIAVTHYYTYKRFLPYNKYIIDRYADRNLIALKEEAFVQKEKSVIEWIIKFKNEYKKNEKLRKFIDERTPILGVSYLDSLRSFIEKMLFKMIVVDRKLDCESKYIKIYLDSSREFVDKNSPLYRLSKSQKEFIYDLYFNSNFSYLYKYIIKKECKKEIDFGYPPQKWIDSVYPSVKKKWIDDDNSSRQEDNLFLDLGSIRAR